MSTHGSELPRTLTEGDGRSGLLSDHTGVFFHRNADNYELAQELLAVESLMVKLATGDRFERLGAILQEHLLTGGKRLRARLALAGSVALGVEASRAVPWAAACELLHNATLIHDDVQDGDAVRRGRFAVWVRHGQGQAINAGDLLLTLPYLALEYMDVPPALCWFLSRAIARRAEETVRGQSLEMCLLNSGRLDWGSYEDAALGKTSALMALPIHGAALLAGLDPSEASALADCFRRIGLLFQIQDDVVDLYGDKGRGERGCDVREGRVSALVADHLAMVPSDTQWLLKILKKPREETSRDDIEEVALRFQKSGALDSVLGRLPRLAKETERSPELANWVGLHRVALDVVEFALAPVKEIFGALD
jgi:geranylgeranyl diphosphate synthase, type I